MIGVSASSYSSAGLTRVAFVRSTNGYTGTGGTQTSAPLNLSANDLLIVGGLSGDDTQTMSTPTSTANITWTLLRSILVSNYSTAYAWSGLVNASLSGATVSVACASGNNPWTFDVTQWRNHRGVGITNKSNYAGQAPSVSMTGTQARSAVQFFSSDWYHVDGAGRAWLSVNGAPMTEDSYSYNSGWYTIYGAYTANIGAGGTINLGLSAPTSGTYSNIGVEILSL